MRLPDRILKPLAERLIGIGNSREPDFRIGAPGDDYLRRWFLTKRRSIQNNYLHHFLRSDDDRALHDHPYANISLLLRGEYVEHTIRPGGINVRTIYRAGDMKFRSAATAHRVELNNGPCWSLFITGPRVREWGFHCERGWVPWQQFTRPENPGEIGRGCGEAEHIER